MLFEEKLEKLFKAGDIPNAIHLREGCLIKVIEMYKDDVSRRNIKRTFKAKVIKEFTNHILVEIDGFNESYRESINKVDVLIGRYLIDVLF